MTRRFPFQMITVLCGCITRAQRYHLSNACWSRAMDSGKRTGVHALAFVKDA